MPTASYAGDVSPAKASSPLGVPLPNRNSSKDDIIKYYQQCYSVKDHLMIKNGFISDASPADGPVSYGFYATVLKPGYYVFTFNHYDDSHFLFEIRKVILNVEKMQEKKESQKTQPEAPGHAEVSPKDSVWRTYRLGSVVANTSDEIVVHWSYLRGGRGLPNGWALAEIEFMESLVQQSNTTSPPKIKSTN